MVIVGKTSSSLAALYQPGKAPDGFTSQERLLMVSPVRKAPDGFTSQDKQAGQAGLGLVQWKGK
jgi:hypothetical protein